LNEKYKLIKRYARSQLDYPEGVGVRHSMSVKADVFEKFGLADETPLVNCSLEVLQVIIKQLVKRWKYLGNLKT